jgi:hypothetical protein
MNRFEWNFSSTADIAIGAMLLALILSVTLYLV